MLIAEWNENTPCSGTDIAMTSEHGAVTRARGSPRRYSASDGGTTPFVNTASCRRASPLLNLMTSLLPTSEPLSGMSGQISARSQPSLSSSLSRASVVSPGAQFRPGTAVQVSLRFELT